MRRTKRARVETCPKDNNEMKGNS